MTNLVCYFFLIVSWKKINLSVGGSDDVSSKEPCFVISTRFPSLSSCALRTLHTFDDASVMDSYAV